MESNNKIYHTPVMLSESIAGLNIESEGVYVDATFGGGGHAREIFNKLNSQGKLIAFDQDIDAKENTWTAPNFKFINTNFSFLHNYLYALNIQHVDGIFADLGVSSHQFDELTRGFSIRGNAPLDMRMNRKNNLNAQIVVNTYSEESLMKIFKNYGELKNFRQITEAIIKQRKESAILFTKDLIDALTYCRPKQKEYKFYAQVFQALRIEVNGELESLKIFLKQSGDVLKPNGRLVIISYHSLEDRIVKNFLKRGNFDGIIEKDFFGNVLKPFDEAVRHPLIPSREECLKNSRARSAKLRIGVKRGNYHT